MQVLLYILLAAALLAVLGVLGAGFYALFRGGEFGRRWSNKLMQLRVLMQFTAIVLLAAIVWLARASHAH